MVEQICNINKAISQMATEQRRISNLVMNLAFNESTTSTTSIGSGSVMPHTDTTIYPPSCKSTVSFVPVGTTLSTDILPSRPGEIMKLPQIDSTILENFIITDQLQSEENESLQHYTDTKKYAATLKIIGVPTNNTIHFANRLVANNRWLKIRYLNIKRVYQTSTSYTYSYNYIVMMDKEAHEACLDYGKLNMGRRTCRIFDEPDIDHCRRCQSLDHTAAYCKNPVIYKYCAANHHHTKCQKQQQQIQCINCIRSNRCGKEYATNHSSTYGGCPTPYTTGKHNTTTTTTHIEENTHRIAMNLLALSRSMTIK